MFVNEGTRMWRRGADTEGYAANFVESEQIMESKGFTASYVQVSFFASFKINLFAFLFICMLPVSLIGYYYCLFDHILIPWQINVLFGSRVDTLFVGADC